MELFDLFWKEYELDLQEIKTAYLKWTLDHAVEPSPLISVSYNTHPTTIKIPEK